jgi:membrane associated rhomboid family serine protease
MTIDRAPAPAARFLPLAVMAGMFWIVEIGDAVLWGGDLDRAGIHPRRLDGLDGVLWAPFLHGGFGHLISNTLPFLILGGLVALRGVRRWLIVTGIIVVAGGLATWVLARPSIHIGASGLVFGYITYLITTGFFERRLRWIMVGVVVFFLYGATLLWGVVPTGDGVSWEGHLFGALAGVLAAWLTARFDPVVTSS